MHCFSYKILQNSVVIKNFTRFHINLLSLFDFELPKKSYHVHTPLDPARHQEINIHHTANHREHLVCLLHRRQHSPTSAANVCVGRKTRTIPVRIKRQLEG